jgi:hypothetical protein
MQRRVAIDKEARMRRWQRVGIAGALALAALLLRPRPAGEPQPAAEAPMRDRIQNQDQAHDARDVGESNDRARHAD